jgi:RNA recognition motif-containing protein
MSDNLPVRDLSKRLFVRNLDFDAQKADIAAYFNKCGEVVDVFPVYRRNSTSNRGFAFVEMASVVEAERAIRELDNTPGPGGRIMNVVFALESV